MIDKAQFQQTPMGVALTELGQKLQDAHMPPVSLNVIGGFALMMREIRNPNDTTDIDYVGKNMPANFNKIADEIGMKHHLGRGWINNDVMLAGISLEDFEMSTGELHFDHAFNVGNISVNVLDEKDLLRMKVLSVDTSLTSVEMGGDFSRMKDMEDVKVLMERQHVSPEQLEDKFGNYIICPYTVDMIKTYHTQGTEGVTREVDAQQKKYMAQLQKERQNRSVQTERSPFLQSLLEDLDRRSRETPDSYFKS